MSVAHAQRDAAFAAGYCRHEPERTALYRVVESTLPEFEAALRSVDLSAPCGEGEAGNVDAEVFAPAEGHFRSADSIHEGGRCAPLGARDVTRSYRIPRCDPD